MVSNKCMNLACGSSTSIEWHKGWAKRSGAFALLCDKCGSAYEKSKFCDEFHLEESGWSPCSLCGKRLHCGCIASQSLIVLRDCGGIFCISCTRDSGLEPVQDSSGALVTKNASEGDQSRLRTHCAGAQADRVRCSPKPNGVGKRVSDVYEPLAQTNLNMAFAAPCANSNAKVSVYEKGEQSITSPQKFLRTKSNRPALELTRLPSKKMEISYLNPLNAPRCTEEELQQLSRATNSTIVPLFEKILTCSDVGRLGRLFLPKACAEAHFPIISKPEGITLPIQDVKGENLKVQYKYWANKKNQLLYFLEGVNPWIQSMQLQSGDTVTFSLMLPKENFLLGFRKAQISDQNASKLELTWKKAQGSLQPSPTANPGIAMIDGHVIEEHDDASMLELTWEEAHGLLQPSPTAKPSIMVIDGHVFEEYEEPPVFGKKSIFVKRSSCTSNELNQEELDSVLKMDNDASVKKDFS